MARYSVWALGESNLSISGGGQLDGVTQGDGSHLVGLTITIDTTNFEELEVRDPGSDTNFDDNDSNQRLRGSQDFDGVTFSNNTRIEAEYIITLRDPNTGIEYEAVAINLNNSSPSYATVEGLAFVDTIPPAGVALEVIGATEGPGGFGVPSLPASDIAVPPCFTPGTRIVTPMGARRVETLAVGDRVQTLDNGAQAILWIGRVDIGRDQMLLNPDLRPVRIARNAFGPGRPRRDMLVSPQHRVLVEGWRAELLFGEAQVLVAAKHLVDGGQVTLARDVDEVCYLHIQFAQHEILLSDGLPTESFNPGPVVMGAIPMAARAELQALFPGVDLDHATPLDAARPLISAREALALNPLAA